MHSPEEEVDYYVEVLDASTAGVKSHASYNENYIS